MDLIYMNAAREDVNVMKDYTFDLAFGADENNFECRIVRENHCCEAGFFLYCEGTEYGGIIDSIEVLAAENEVAYIGRSWHGILDTKIIEPDEGEDYLTVSGEANAVLDSLIKRMGLSDLFVASGDVSGITISAYQMHRYVTGYSGIRKMLKAAGAKLLLSFRNGMVVLSAVPFVDYSEDKQFDTDQIEFTVRKNSHPLNHVICLGKGELAEREVIHVYADADGSISDVQSLTGIREVAAVYENVNADSSEELRQGGIELIRKSQASDEIKFDFNSNETTFDVGDIVGAVEYVTGIEVRAEITKKIVTINKYITTISYKVGE